MGVSLLIFYTLKSAHTGQWSDTVPPPLDSSGDMGTLLRLRPSLTTPHRP